ncbi:hypothetical protein J6590_017809 [Homalodisca vitripennis]|nr:hypothetical protein J6590_017809 [Homalodisca vitripennis]
MWISSKGLSSSKNSTDANEKEGQNDCRELSYVYSFEQNNSNKQQTGSGSLWISAPIFSEFAWSTSNVPLHDWPQFQRSFHVKIRLAESQN